MRDFSLLDSLLRIGGVLDGAPSMDFQEFEALVQRDENGPSLERLVRLAEEHEPAASVPVLFALMTLCAGEQVCSFNETLRLHERAVVLLEKASLETRQEMDGILEASPLMR